MKARLIKNTFNAITTILHLILMSPIAIQAQTDTVENYFPIKVGTTWVYKLYPEYSNERERLTITKDSISVNDNSHYLFYNDAVTPKYRVDTIGNVFFRPLAKKGQNSNFLIFKQNAKNLEAWAGSDSTSLIFRIKNIGLDFILGRWVKYKSVEWGVKIDPDTFSFSNRTEYYAEGFGLYFVIVEPPSTERLLVGFISNGDTLGDITKVIDLSNSQLSSFILDQNYPNPFNPSTTISFNLPSKSFVSLKIFDVLGREVSTLVNEELSAGKQMRQWNASNVASGMYFYRLKAGSFTETKKLLLLR